MPHPSLFKAMLLLGLLCSLAGVNGASAQTYPPEISAINPASIVQVNTAADAATIRSNLVEQVFNRPSLDTTLVPIHDSNYPGDATWSAYPNMGQIKAQHVELPFGLSSRIWRFEPVTPRTANGKCGFIVHAGHSQRSTKPPYRDLIGRLVGLGCEVVAIDMPLSGLNDIPTVVDTPWGKFDVTRYARPHNNLQITAHPTFNPLRFYLEPVLAVVNDFTNRGIANIGMFGLSGGGWTTDVYAALDERVDLSYSLAGSMPVYMRSWVPPLSTGSFGDWEQMQIPHLGVDYMDLYILGSVGAGRRHVNLYIVNDDCCFGGYNANHFAPTVAARVQAIGGSFQIAFDTSVSTHTVSAWTVTIVATEVQALF